MEIPFRILVVEDEPVIRELVRSLLSEAACEVETAATGIEGLRMAKSRPFDLILLDVVLPSNDSVQLDGVSLCRLLRADARLASVPIYMLTAKAKRADVDAATGAGASGYIHKPFRGVELIDLVTKLRPARAL